MAGREESVIETFGSQSVGETARITDEDDVVVNGVVASEDVNIAIGEKLSTLALSQESMPYFTAFIAAASYYCLTEKVKQLDEPLFVKAIKALLDFYEPNRKLTGKVEVLEDYLKQREKENWKNSFTRISLLTKSYSRIRTRFNDSAVFQILVRPCGLPVRTGRTESSLPTD